VHIETSLVQGQGHTLKSKVMLPYFMSTP